MNLIMKLNTFDEYADELAAMAILPVREEMIKRMREEIRVIRKISSEPYPNSVTYNVSRAEWEWPFFIKDPAYYDEVFSESTIGFLNECEEKETCFIPDDAMPDDLKEMIERDDCNEQPGIDYVARRYYPKISLEPSVMLYGYHKWGGQLFESETIPTSQILSCLK